MSHVSEGGHGLTCCEGWAAAGKHSHGLLTVLVEPSGAVGVAALLTGKLPGDGKNVVAVLSGGNISLDAVQQIRLELTQSTEPNTALKR